MSEEVSKAGKIATVLMFVLILFGLIMLSSAGVVEGQKNCGSPYCYVTHQVVSGVLLGIVVFVICSKIPFEKWRPFAFPLLLFSLTLLILVFVPGLGRGVKGAQRWLDLRVTVVQPAEFFKLSLIMYVAAWFGGREKGIKTISSVVPFFLVLGTGGVLLAMQPDIGTLGIVILIGIAMYFFSGAKLKHFFVLIGICLVLIGGLSLAAPYRFARVKTFLNPESDRLGTSYHINQALISIGSGGIWGVGYGQSKQKFNLLPEPVGDSIFAIIVEELGFVGGVFLISLFVAFIFCLLQIAKQRTDVFGRLFVLGVAVWVGGQAFINIAAISGLIPLTGVPLPLISYGSSSLVSIMAGVGIVRSIAKG